MNELTATYHQNTTVFPEAFTAVNTGSQMSPGKTNGCFFQRLDYYPFGMQMPGLHYAGGGAPENKYLYNGKELVDDSKINWYDYGFRKYDPALGRWHVPDLLAERFYSISPYNYCYNNPVNFIDPYGLQGEITSVDYIDPVIKTGEQSTGAFFQSFSFHDPVYSYYNFTFAYYTGVQNYLYNIELYHYNYLESKTVKDMGILDVPEFSGISSIDLNEGGYGSGNTMAANGGAIDNTWQAWNHYFNGNGNAVNLGPNTVNALLNSRDFQYRHNRIITGQTRSLVGNFSVNMTRSVFHVGNTNINYSINCASGNCNVTYELFVNDGFWDVDYIDEKVLGNWLGIDKFKPDGLGPNLERFGGTPYPYIPTIRIFTFPNPGY